MSWQKKSKTWYKIRNRSETRPINCSLHLLLEKGKMQNINLVIKVEGWGCSVLWCNGSRVYHVQQPQQLIGICSWKLSNQPLHRDGTRAVYLIGLHVLAGALPFSVRTLTAKKPVLHQHSQSSKPEAKPFARRIVSSDAQRALGQ
jgi:hypothetical protein